MPLPYFPHAGEILVCSFDKVALGAEIIKPRPVVVVSPRATHGRRLCTVVPLSTTAPQAAQAWHHPLPGLQVTGWRASGDIWAKCDMLSTVSFDRLNKPYRTSRSGRLYVTHQLPAPDLQAIRTCLRSYLGL